MKNSEKYARKELYAQLRALSWEQLWEDEARRFDRASPSERNDRAAVVRAIGVVFSETGPSETKENVKHWLLRLLDDPSEKIRRYAVAALPKIGAGRDAETRLTALLRETKNERERKSVMEALEKIGGASALAAIRAAGPHPSALTEQRIKASLLREDAPSSLRRDGMLADFAGLRVHLRGRRGLESIVREEVEEFIARHGKFRIAAVADGLVALAPLAPFSLDEIYQLRCFGTVGFVPIQFTADKASVLDELASAIASGPALAVFRAFTNGGIRYRLNFSGKGHQRAAVRELAGKVYQLRPEILNDARSVTWTVDIYSHEDGGFVELRPNVTPDPRFAYRRRDVPAASHPQLAACMARLAGRVDDEVVWDPFCGSGLELIEVALLGGVRAFHGTDLSAEAITIARDNFAAASAGKASPNFSLCDFRDYAKSDVFQKERASLVITNPPMGMRVQIKDLRGLMSDLFTAAAKVLRPGGRLVFANPFSKHQARPGFELQFRQPVDFGGFDCRLEKYVKL